MDYRRNKIENLDNTPIVFCMTHEKAMRIISDYSAIRPNHKVNYIIANEKKIAGKTLDKIINLQKEKIINTASVINGNIKGVKHERNIYSALLNLCQDGCDMIVVSFVEEYEHGYTKYDFCGLELGYYLDSVQNLGGYSILAVDTDVWREKIEIMDFNITILKNIACMRTTIPIKFSSRKIKDQILEKIFEHELHKKHNIISLEDYGEKSVDIKDYNKNQICDGIIEYILNYNPGR